MEIGGLTLFQTVPGYLLWQTTIFSKPLCYSRRYSNQGLDSLEIRSLLLLLLMGSSARVVWYSWSGIHEGTHVSLSIWAIAINSCELSVKSGPVCWGSCCCCWGQCCWNASNLWHCKLAYLAMPCTKRLRTTKAIIYETWNLLEQIWNDMKDNTYQLSWPSECPTAKTRFKYYCLWPSLWNLWCCLSVFLQMKLPISNALLIQLYD